MEKMIFGDLIMAWSSLGPDERRVLVAIAKRLEMGQETYGHELFKKKSITRELHEELLDACVYGAVATLE